MSTLGVALVTGAGRGLGRVIALRLARDGYDLALSDLHANQALVETLAAEVENRGRKYTVVPANVKSEAEVQGMVKRTVKDLGGLDVTIANAGTAIMKPLLDVEAGDWDEVQAVKGRGTFLCYKYAAKLIEDQGRGGRIIGASKFTIRGLTQAAGRWISHDITVNAYSPSVVDTRMGDP
ncbi:NAD(P)-binding protein [Pleurotus eryngii]|uniref:NAD(P)-binding protein n=1 Tax=Pleurotus eryngii TaxID=5323 RepID=A0A9P5ZTY2_PLEER|nr:NAD(P)-binding protein [Pleurotus eryngii]